MIPHHTIIMTHAAHSRAIYVIEQIVIGKRSHEGKISAARQQ